MLQAKLTLNTVTHNEAIVVVCAVSLVILTVLALAYISERWSWMPRKRATRVYGQRR